MMNYQNQQPINQFYQPQQQYMPNPYMQRMENLQQFQQAIQPQPQMQGANNFTPLGKIVDSVDIVKATDIPMDGNIYYFPKADGSEIFGKQWLANGQTRILTFKPFSDAEPNNSADKDLKSQIALSDELTEAFMKRFDDLEMQMKEILSKSATKNTTSRSKKEVAEDE